MFGALLQEDLVDELFLTLAPKLAGGGERPRSRAARSSWTCRAPAGLGARGRRRTVLRFALTEPFAKNGGPPHLAVNRSPASCSIHRDFAEINQRPLALDGSEPPDRSHGASDCGAGRSKLWRRRGSVPRAGGIVRHRRRSRTRPLPADEPARLGSRAHRRVRGPVARRTGTAASRCCTMSSRRCLRRVRDAARRPRRPPVAGTARTPRSTSRRSGLADALR